VTDTAIRAGGAAQVRLPHESRAGQFFRDRQGVPFRPGARA
jgi:hypothetical protein